jgi:hypothetical protein
MPIFETTTPNIDTFEHNLNDIDSNSTFQQMPTPWNQSFEKIKKKKKKKPTS